MAMHDLIQLGWDDFFKGQLSDEELKSLVIGRVVEPLRGLSRTICPEGEIWAEHSEKSATGAKTREAVPSIGDWVVGNVRNLGGGEMRMSIKRVLARKNKLSRAAPGGKNYEQILCTNVDTAFLVLAVSQPLNLPGVGRYLEILSEAKILPVLIVSKVSAEVEASPLFTEVMSALKQAAPGVVIHVVGVKEGRGLAPLAQYFLGNKTTVLLGASGAGKSTLTNALLGVQAQRVEEVRESDQKGRHTTTARRLHSLPNGGMVIDAPGIREIQKWVEPEPRVESSDKKKIKTGKPARGFRYSEGDDDEGY